MGEQFDVVVIGARVAGAPLATLLARRGVRVALIEQATFPRPTLSSHCIQPDGVAFLDRLGVLPQIQATGAPLMTRVDVRFDDFRVVEDYPRFPGFVGAVSVRRHVLDPILADAAVAGGADVRMASKAVGLLRDRNGRVSGVRVEHQGEQGKTEYDISARLVVGADGRESTVAKSVGARKYHVAHNERHYYWAYFEGYDTSVTPTFVVHRWGDRFNFAGPADNGLYIAGVSPEKHERERFREDRLGMLMDHVRSCEPLAEILADARVSGKIPGIVNFHGYFAESSGPGWVLIGDSGHFKDPAAGRGIGDALRQVDWLAPQIIKALSAPSPDAALDEATTRFARWRDRTYADWYWMAVDLGKAGTQPSIVPEVVDRLHRGGKIDDFLEMLSHRVTPSELITPGRVLGAASRRVLRGGPGRREFAQELGVTMRTEFHRRRLNRRPVYEDRHTLREARAAS